MIKWFFGLALAFAAPVSAEVVSSSPHGFELSHSINLVVPQPRAYAAIGQVESWWSKDHTYSGDASRLSLQLRPGGCFCERLDGGGGVEHLRVTFVQPGERVVLTGGLGPLLFEATTGVMDFQVERIAGGSRITMNYRAAGFARGNAADLAPAVDKVLAEQMKRLRTFAAGGKR
ncbi:MAG: ATPase [Pseudomonadota bacterium]|nr:ATPase [Pseudomonadota bacterium]